MISSFGMQHYANQSASPEFLTKDRQLMKVSLFVLHYVRANPALVGLSLYSLFRLVSPLEFFFFRYISFSRIYFTAIRSKLHMLIIPECWLVAVRNCLAVRLRMNESTLKSGTQRLWIPGLCGKVCSESFLIPLRHWLLHQQLITFISVSNWP